MAPTVNMSVPLANIRGSGPPRSDKDLTKTTEMRKLLVLELVTGTLQDVCRHTIHDNKLVGYVLEKCNLPIRDSK